MRYLVLAALVACTPEAPKFRYNDCVWIIRPDESMVFNRCAPIGWIFDYRDGGLYKVRVDCMGEQSATWALERDLHAVPCPE